ncbi:YraN family protein [Alloalcanivorax sp. C16-1]|uniref:YraN family protein n=1 Tax=Alloalcanivorax sp. C16-1 TaxID=3390051 RepID=UPI003970A48D
MEGNNRDWRRQRGLRAERRVLEWLRERGLTPLAANYRCRLGEVDLIMEHGDTLVFVEVRWRAGRGYGGALASVDTRKQRRLVRAARHFLGRYPFQARRPCRFDVVGLEPDEQGAVRYDWIQNAFYGDG